MESVFLCDLSAHSSVKKLLLVNSENFPFGFRRRRLAGSLSLRIPAASLSSKHAASSALRTKSLPWAITGWFQVLPSIALNFATSLCFADCASTSTTFPLLGQHEQQPLVDQ